MPITDPRLDRIVRKLTVHEITDLIALVNEMTETKIVQTQKATIRMQAEVIDSLKYRICCLEALISTMKEKS